MTKIQGIINELKRWFPNREKDDDCLNLSDESLDILIRALKSYENNVGVETSFEVYDIQSRDSIRLISMDVIKISGGLSSAVMDYLKKGDYSPSDFRIVRRISGSDCKWFAVPNDLGTDGEELLFEERV